MRRWVDDIREAFSRVGGQAKLQDLWPVIYEIRNEHDPESLKTHWRQTVRGQIQEHLRGASRFERIPRSKRTWIFSRVGPKGAAEYRLVDIAGIQEWPLSEAKEIKDKSIGDPDEGPIPKKIQVEVSIFERNPRVVAFALRRADGECEACGNKAPFQRNVDQTPYLEVHHKVHLAEGGEDTIANVVALCPNCHRQEHFGVRRWTKL